ncbi:MAG: hypothetical protein JXR10_04040 [Cyclobacteriaceae bacterium]
MSKAAIHIIQGKWKALVFLKCLAWLVTVGAVIFVLSMMLTFEWYWLLVALITLAVMIRMELRNLPSKASLVKLVNEQYDLAEYSTDLLFITPQNELQALQQSRVKTIMQRQLPSFRYPIVWKDWMMTSAILTLILIALKLWPSQTPETETTNSNLDTPKTVEALVADDSVFIIDNRVTIAAPRYTGLAKKYTSQLDFNAPERSNIQWKLTYNGQPTAVWIVVNGGDSIAAISEGGKYRIDLKVYSSSLYTINHLDEKGRLTSSAYYELNVTLDEPPKVEVEGIPPFQRLDYQEEMAIAMDVTLSDDYGLTDGYIVATITKGSGESVKFREQKIELSGKIVGKKAKRSVSFEMDQLGMEPGNELYFYVTGFDNKAPKKQQTRTETYFVILKDTAEVEFSLQGALGVDLMPDFFRSQLQIIIDTKKLIEDRSKMTKYEFNSASNALGFDQKQLRLKYGQFIGEEEDSGLEVNEEPIEPSTEGEDVLQEFGHDTDHENEEGQWMDRGTEAHDHDHEQHHEEENPLEQFMHNHEDEETATFYTQSLKSKLRAALAEMWDAELYLRLYKPQESLPYQLKAQALLKEIRNHARIYVQRIGFEPPPVNENESRLTGKLKELNARAFTATVEKDILYPEIRAAIRWIDQYQFGNEEWTERSRMLIKKAGDELAGLAIDNPGKYLETLNRLKVLLRKSQLLKEDRKTLLNIRSVLVQAIPEDEALPAPAQRPDDAFAESFIEALLKNTNQ